MLHISSTYITDNTTSNRRNLIDCIGVYTTENKTKQNVRRENLPTKEARNVRNELSGIYVEIKCQLYATDDFYCRSYCLLNMFRAQLCPSSGAREYYTGGCCLWYSGALVFKLSVWCGAEGYVSGLRAAARKPDT